MLDIKTLIKTIRYCNSEQDNGCEDCPVYAGVDPADTEAVNEAQNNCATLHEQSATALELLLTAESFAVIAELSKMAEETEDEDAAE